MSEAEFVRMSWLLFPIEAARVTGWSKDYVLKLIENQVLHQVKPKGTRHSKVRKVQLAQLLGLNLGPDRARFVEGERLLMTPKAVMAWTGYDRRTLEKIAAAGGLTRVRLPGGGNAPRFRKSEVAELIGLKI
jgi:excisionase family DNA binding protein